MSKLNKKGRNPNGGPLDCWLDSLGYYRKNVAYDETCLFRAVSEQLFSCQLFHEKVRSECIEYATNNSREFSHIDSNASRWLERLDKLSKHMIICGEVEICIISRKYKKNILLFNESELSTTQMNISDADGMLYLCFMGEDHYDVIYKKDYISNAGFCQSIVYSIIYESVFCMMQVSEIVDHMLNEKPSTIQMTDDLIERMKIAEEVGVLINNDDITDIYAAFTNNSSNQNDDDAVTSNDVDNCFENWTEFNANLPSTSNGRSAANASANHWVESKVQTQRLQLQLGLSAQTEKLVQHKHLFNTKPPNVHQLHIAPASLAAQALSNGGANGDENNMVRAGGCWLYTGSSLGAVAGVGNSESPGEAAVHPLTDLEMLICGKIAPFPYKVAKALDPNIYRNIEYDTWSEMRKEMRLCNWYYGDNNFKEGTCCRIDIDGVTYPCYIQNINGDKCDIFLTHSAERRTVHMKDLLPEEDAKPWPIPYRFTKNSQSLNVTPYSNVMDTYKRNRGKRKGDKKRTISNGSSNLGSLDDHSIAIQQNPYEGCPLVQHHPQHQSNTQPQHQLPISTLPLIDTSLPPPPIAAISPTLQQAIPLLSLAPVPQPPPSVPCTSSSATTLLPLNQQQQQQHCHTAASDASSLVVWDTSYWENAMPPATPDNAHVPQWVSVGTGGGWVDQQQQHVQQMQQDVGGVMSPAVVGMYAYGQIDPNYYYNGADGSYANVWTEYPTVVPITSQDGHIEHVPCMVATPAPAFVHPMSPQVIDALYHSHPSTPIPPLTPYPCTPPGTPILYQAAPSPLIQPHSPYQDIPTPTTNHPLSHLFVPTVHHLPSPSPLTTAGPLTPLTPTNTNMSPSCAPSDMQPTVVPYIQTIPTPTYVYPTTPTWYPPGINAHGFIFPTVAVQGGGNSGAAPAGAAAV